MQKNNELNFIDIIKNSLDDSSYIGDDCAYIKELELVISSDSLCEGVHFYSNINTKILARKAMLVNISDILASGAMPKYATINISGDLNEKFIEEFYFEINKVALEYDIKIIGGDLTKADKLSISITILADARNRNISSRKNAKKDYVLAVCGEFGVSARGFLEISEDNYFSKRHLTPKLYPKISEKIATSAKKPYAMMDCSDSLMNCLEWFKNESNVGVEIDFNKIPTQEGTQAEHILYGGEDYSLVIALDKDDYRALCEEDIIVIGKITDTKEIVVKNIDLNSLNKKEFSHFN